ncbi:MAG: rRNA maturation RNase YbeY [Thermomicrobiales bacterium]
MSEPGIAELTVEASLPLPAGVTDESIASLVLHVLCAEEADGDWTLGFRFVDDAEMQRMHLAFMGLDSSTDIMTFPIADDDAWSFGVDDDDAAESCGGDIVISVDRAVDQAGEGDWDDRHELLFLIVHGLLHLLGWDDHDNADRVAMLDRQRDLLGSWEASGNLG